MSADAKNVSIFRAYDIRGVYGTDIDESVAVDLGRTFGEFIGHGKKIVVSRDTRESGESLKKSFIQGLVESGCNVIDIGTTTTPMMYFAVRMLGADGGTSVTASHNPREWNGFKMTREGGILCSEGFGMEEIKGIYTRGQFTRPKKQGKVETRDIFPDYEAYIRSKIVTKKRMRIVLDPGNGAACNICDRLFRSMGHEVFVVNGEPDGRFPNRPSDPQEKNVSTLMETVVDKGADMGIAFDGDADRVAFVDDKGKYLQSGNVTIPIFSGHYLKSNPGRNVVYDVCCSAYVEEAIKKDGGKPVVSKVGHSFVMNSVIQSGAIFGGEYSNHLYFNELFGFDDAMFAGLKMVEIVGSSGERLSDMVGKIPVYPASPVIEMACDDNEKFDVVRSIAESLDKGDYRIVDIDGVKAFDESGGWFLIRASNTLPVIKLNSEARTKERMEDLLRTAVKLVKERTQ